jgi:uncharacterized protein
VSQVNLAGVLYCAKAAIPIMSKQRYGRIINIAALLGATSVGAPPVTLHLLSGPDPVAVTRANLTVFVTAIFRIGLVMLGAAGAISASQATSATLLTIPFLLATWLGTKLFARLSDAGVRRIALCLMLFVGVANLFL